MLFLFLIFVVVTRPSSDSLSPAFFILSSCSMIHLQRANAQRVKEFSRNLRMINKQMATQQDGRKSNKMRPLSKREKAHMYASQIKKPVQIADADFFDSSRFEQTEADSDYGGQQTSYDDVTPLDRMELEHEKNRYDVESIRKGYGI
jgi:hypothetical protein